MHAVLKAASKSTGPSADSAGCHRVPAATVLLAVVVTLGSPTAAAGQESGTAGTAAEKALRITAVNLSADEARHREMAERGLDSNSLLPGDVVQYRLRFTNVKEVPVRNVVIDDPVPEGLQYVAGSATADHPGVEIQYSIDGGRAYSKRPTIQKVVDGKEVEAPAPPESYTHIRWIVRDWIQPGSALTASFRATLPEPGDSEDGRVGQTGVESRAGEAATGGAFERGSDDR